jgi:ubiquinone/menaquinone biosynthesis C-methylase UbiE
MAANYNNSAWFYDRLARLVYGKSLLKAQVYLLQFIQPHSNVLIVGGGTGWILEELTALHPAGLNITYVEIAPNMMALSQKRDTGNNQVNFITAAIENVELPADFDIALTPFLFDNFKEETFHKVFDAINALLKQDGTWLNCDFQLNGKWWQWAMLKSMFIFFRLICNIEASKLPGIEKRFRDGGYKVIEENTFFGGFISAKIYKH